jgi:hypothetical protein
MNGSVDVLQVLAREQAADKREADLAAREAAVTAREAAAEAPAAEPEAEKAAEPEAVVSFNSIIFLLLPIFGHARGCIQPQSQSLLKSLFCPDCLLSQTREEKGN